MQPNNIWQVFTKGSGMRTENKLFLITGHSRTGTTYMSYLFSMLGYDVGHEKMGEHGISSWMMAACVNPTWGEQVIRNQFNFKYIIHNIRNPVDTISSIIAEDSHHDRCRARRFRERFIIIDGNPVEAAVRSYLGWHKLIMSIKPDLVVKVEDAKHIIPKWLVNEAKLPVKEENKDLDSNINNRDKHEVSVNEIVEHTNNEILDKLLEFCSKYYKDVEEKLNAVY